MINQVTLVGRLTKDPELRTTNDGILVTHVTLAVNRHFKNQNGEIEADFVQCTLWRKTAENTARFCRKGSVIGITGRIQSRHYDNNDGKRVYVTEVVAETVQFLGKRVTANAPVAVPQPQPLRQAAGGSNSGTETNSAAGASAPQQSGSSAVAVATQSASAQGNAAVGTVATVADSPPQQDSTHTSTSQPLREAVDTTASLPQREAHGFTVAQASSDQSSAAAISAVMAMSESGHGAQSDSADPPF